LFAGAGLSAAGAQDPPKAPALPWRPNESGRKARKVPPRYGEPGEDVVPDGYFFFLSYAREDGEESFARFKRDLEAAVRARTDHAPDRISFRDRTELEVGDTWLPDLSDAIRTCRVFVPVLTRRYFTKDFCGREWAAFKRRVHLAARGNTPRLIIPVLWGSGKDAILPGIPSAVGALQLDHEALPEQYSEEGLRFLYKISKFESEAQEVVERLADRIVAVAKDAVPHLPDADQLDQIESAWKPTTAAAALMAEQSGSGPRYVQFVFVAGSVAEMRRVRARLDHYGALPLDWKPFAPEVSDEIALIAQQVAADQKLISTVFPVAPDVLNRIAAAERDGTLVAIVVDTWTLQVGGPYEQMLRDYDGRRFANCAVLVPWNTQDEETTRDKAQLEKRLLAILTRSKAGNDPRFFVDQINSSDQFRDDLTRTLAALRAQVATFAAVQKQALGQNGQAIARPII
jgi:FxsC-like protein